MWSVFPPHWDECNQDLPGGPCAPHPAHDTSLLLWATSCRHRARSWFGIEFQAKLTLKTQSQRQRICTATLCVSRPSKCALQPPRRSPNASSWKHRCATCSLSRPTDSELIGANSSKGLCMRSNLKHVCHTQTELRLRDKRLEPPLRTVVHHKSQTGAVCRVR